MSVRLKLCGVRTAEDALLGAREGADEIGVVFAARLLLDGPAAGSGKSFAWTLAEQARAYAVPLFVAGGLTPQNVAQAIAEARPDGVDVASGIENPQGFKDPQRVRAFVRAARGASR